MSTIDQTTEFPYWASQDVAVTKWANMAAGDEGNDVALTQYSDRTVQIEGTFGGAAVKLKGSNDLTNWYTLTDPQGNALSFSAPGLRAVMELPLKVKPVVEGGDGTTTITATMSGRKSI